MRGRTLATAALAAGLLPFAIGCGPKPVFRNDPGRRPAPGPPAPAAVPATRVEEVASSWLGTPYRYGGVDARGIDCSALAQNVLGDLGASLPRTTRAQTGAGRAVGRSDIRAGDLVFFRLDSALPDHVGVALGPDRFVHASSSRGVVVDRLMDDYFARRFAQARRVLGGP